MKANLCGVLHGLKGARFYLALSRPELCAWANKKPCQKHG